MRGIEFPNPPGEDDFIAAYGVREGNLRYTEFKNTQIAGQYIGSFRNMPTSSITAYVEQLRPDTGDTGEGYAARAALYDNVVSAANQVIKQRQSDPVQFSLSSGQAKPIDMSNKDNFGQSVALRAAQVSDLAKSYGTPLTFFSKTRPIRSVFSFVMLQFPNRQHISIPSGRALVVGRCICQHYSRSVPTLHLLPLPGY